MAAQINFTKRTLDDLPAAPAGKRIYFNDTRVAGLQLAVTSNGTKTFVLYRKIEGKPTRVKLGHYPDMTPERARKRAEIVRGHIASGGNPTVDKRVEQAQAITLTQAFAGFLKARSLKPKTVYDYERIMRVAFPDWQAKQLVDITKDKVAQRFDRLTREHGKAYANLAMRCFRSVWNVAAGSYEDAEGNSLLPTNPVERISKTRAWHRIKPRSSLIKAHQLPAWFKAVMEMKNEPAGSQAALVADYLLLVLFTGLRRQEAARLTWAQVDFPGRTLTIIDTKNGEDHTLPLSGFLYDLLRNRQAETNSDYVFPGDGKAGYLAEPRPQMRKISQASGVEFTLHDLRRTFVTVAESLDIPAYALKRLLNHKMARDVTAGYIVADVERLRAPMQRITDFLLRLSIADASVSTDSVCAETLTQ